MDVAIDLETMGTSPSSVILSIGAACSDGTTFSANIEPGKQQRTYSAATAEWWAHPDRAEARERLDKNQVSLSHALTDFRAWMAAKAQQAGDEGVLVWGNGSDFDNAILAHAFGQLGMDVPWNFWNNRCLRTLRDNAKLLSEAGGGTLPARRRPTVAHVAVDDALAQLRTVQELRAWIQTATRRLRDG